MIGALHQPVFSGAMPVFAQPATPAPSAPVDKKEQLDQERRELWRAIRIPTAAAGVTGAVAGGVAGALGGVAGAIAGTGFSVVGGAIGVALGGYVGLRVGSHYGFGKDLLGFFLVIGTTVVGAAAGGFAGFYGGGALGAMAGNAGGILGAAVGAVGMGPIGAGVGAVAASAHQLTAHGDKYPALREELAKPD